MADLTHRLRGHQEPEPVLARLGAAREHRRAGDARVRRRLGRRRVEDARRPHRQRVEPLRRRSTTRRQASMGFNNIELITDRPLEVNLREIREVKKRYPEARGHRLADGRDASDDWHDAHPQGRGRRLRRPRAQLRLPARHVRARHGLGRRPGAEAAQGDHALGEGVREDAGPREAHARTPATSPSPARRRARAGADGVSLINTIKSLIGVDLERMVPAPARRRRLDQRRLLRPRGQAHRAPHGRRARARPAHRKLPISGIGGISNWRDAAEFIALGRPACRCAPRSCTTATASSSDMIEGLSRLPRQPRDEDRERARRPRGPAATRSGATSTSPTSVVAKIDAQDLHRLPALLRRLHGRRAPVHLHRPAARAEARPPATRTRPGTCRIAPSPPSVGAIAGDRVPCVDEPECIGCNLCRWCARSPGCITMEEIPTGKPETWNDRVRDERDKVPGGIHDPRRHLQKEEKQRRGGVSHPSTASPLLFFL